MNTLEELIDELPLDHQQDSQDFIRFLLERRARQANAGMTRDYREHYAPQHVETLPELVRSLPTDIEQEVRDFVEFLLTRRAKKPRGIPTFEWAGALKDLRDQYTSVSLQHQLSAWRGTE